VPDEVTLMSVKEGDSVSFNSDLTEIMNGDLIQWKFEKQNTLIAEINKRTDRFTVYDDVLDGRFRDRLKLDNQTGSLTITDTTTEHAGSYKLQINSVRKFFHLTVYDAVTSVSVMEGDSVILNSGLTEMHGDLFQWVFLNSLIGHINLKAGHITLFDFDDGRFRDRLIVDKQTGSLTITNITTEHSGLYELQIYSGNQFKKFSLGVYTQPTVPVISRNSSQCSSSSSYCSLVCSVVNVEYQDKNTYSCVLNNPISNQTQHLDISKLCHTCSDSVHCCGSTEAVIRLVLSALVGVATIALVVYDIRSRRAEQDQAQFSQVNSVIKSFSLTVNENIDPGLYTIPFLQKTRDRLKLDDQTGSLTFTNLTSEQWKLSASQQRCDQESQSHCLHSSACSCHQQKLYAMFFIIRLSALVGVASALALVYDIKC
ncbi:hypothetical protein QQF64_019872, partial [Cirrhinus molitorella]